MGGLLQGVMIICPYCDRAISESGVLFGSDLLHAQCYAALGADLDALGGPDAIETGESGNGGLPGGQAQSAINYRAAEAA